MINGVFIDLKQMAHLGISESVVSKWRYIFHSDLLSILRTHLSVEIWKMASQTPPRKILFLTNVERGEANVFLATCDALLRLAPSIKLHFATFSGLEDAVASVGRHVRESVPQAEPITFHKIDGISMEDSLKQLFKREKVPTRAGYPPNSYLERPGIINTTRALRDTIPVFVPYNGPQMVEIFSSICETIKKVDADLVVVNSLMTPGLTACYHLGIKFTCLSPNSIKDFAAAVQPKAAGLWKVPAYVLTLSEGIL